MTNLDQTLNDTITTLSERTVTELADLVKILERAYVHVLIEQHLRANTGTHVAGVSFLGGKRSNL